MDKSVQVRVLYSQGCPNLSPTVDLIERMGKDAGVSIALEKVLVTSQAVAVKFQYLGSPTVQIDGLDIDPLTRESMAFGLG